MNNALPSALKIPLWIKVCYTAFMAVLIPVYWYHYGPSNFLYFCDVALLLTLAGVWTESALFISMPAVGILLPQALWCADFAVELTGHKFTGMTSYMFDEQKPLFLRGLSFFHGWLPFLLLGLVWKTGYDRRALKMWSLLALGLCLVAWLFFPAPGAVLSFINEPSNINYVFGMSESKPQTWMHPALYLTVWVVALNLLVYLPTHGLLVKLAPNPEQAAAKLA